MKLRTIPRSIVAITRSDTAARLKKPPNGGLGVLGQIVPRLVEVAKEQGTGCATKRKVKNRAATWMDHMVIQGSENRRTPAIPYLVQVCPYICPFYYCSSFRPIKELFSGKNGALGHHAVLLVVLAKGSDREPVSRQETVTSSVPKLGTPCITRRESAWTKSAKVKLLTLTMD